MHIPFANELLKLRTQRYCQMLWTDRPDQAVSFTPSSSGLRC
jgi:hypothetical protein